MQAENPDTSAQQMQDILARQKAAHLADGPPPAARRIEWLDKAIDLLRAHGPKLNQAMREDFGQRSMDESNMNDISGTLDTLRYARKRVSQWMRPEKRSTLFPLNLLGARSQVQFQPKGAVGVVSPWNFPVNLTFAPLAGVFAAGNRAMVKPSEHTPRTSELMRQLISAAYAEEELAVVTGGPEVGAAFTALPFDHLVFTGGTAVAHHVMRSAADHLVPLTLELGGKSPVVIGASADIGKAATRVMAGKVLNAGQVCLAPDYVFLPEGQRDAFVAAATAAVANMFPDGLRDNDDYTSIIHQRHFLRLEAYLGEARARGVEVVEINPAGEDFSSQAHHKMAPQLVLEPADDLGVMREEIFGPILPLKTYTDIEDVLGYINARPRPLALYYFGEDGAERDRVIGHTSSGGVTINDVYFHVGQEDLPFGGIGASGMGRYHGHDGFLEFSHARAVYTQTKGEVLAVIRPPYGEKFRKLIGKRIQAR
jgi:coniferyl-aldehyde dehydrogenase